MIGNIRQKVIICDDVRQEPHCFAETNKYREATSNSSSGNALASCHVHLTTVKRRHILNLMLDFPFEICSDH